MQEEEDEDIGLAAAKAFPLQLWHLLEVVVPDSCGPDDHSYLFA